MHDLVLGNRRHCPVDGTMLEGRRTRSDVDQQQEDIRQKTTSIESLR